VRWRARLTAGLAGAALTVTALAALVAVADGARPGDVLYDLKRGTEQTQLALAGDGRGQTLLDFASTRLDELEALVGDSGTALPAGPAGVADGTVSAAGADPDLVLETLQTMDEQTREGAVWLTGRAVETSDDRPVDLLATWTDGQAVELAALQDLVPDEAAAAVGQSLGLLTEIGARTDGLQAALVCPAGPAVDGTDDLGPVPAAVCAAPEGTPPATASGGSTGSGTTGTPGGGATPVTTTPGAPAAASTTGSGTASPSGSLPFATLPTPGGLLPSLSGGVSGKTTGGSSSSSSPPPVIQGPGSGPVTICLPPLATVGDC
jgi:hypothetical protein